MDDQRRFSDDEVEEIFARATHREKAGPARPGTGLTLPELREIAADAGIDPELVADAAREVALHGPRKGSSSRGLFEAERTVPATLSDHGWARTVGDLREIFGRNGIVTEFGDVREWCSDNVGGETGAVTVRIEPREDGSLVTMRQDTGSLRQVPWALGGTFGAMAAIFSVLFLVGDFEAKTLALPIMMAFFAAASLGGGLLAIRSWEGRQDARFRQALDRIELALRSHPGTDQKGLVASADPGNRAPPSEPDTAAGEET